ncbi:hypothetical protein [Streptomyces sp. CBMA152]|uniref:hypothetical protein n=1 Tax=Streptomyces sp. CBMA152 TaxID=1896312 RepID=UPI00166015CB|nr:hypothetical protein [Streptomyces sp. CBMA152]
MSIARKRTRLAGAVVGMTALAALASTATAAPSHAADGAVTRAAAWGSTTGLQYWVNCEEGSDGTGTNPTISTILTGKRIVQGSARQGNTLVLDFKYTYVQVVPSPFGGAPSRVAVEDDLSCGKSLSSGNILFHTRNGKVVNP